MIRLDHALARRRSDLISLRERFRLYRSLVGSRENMSPADVYLLYALLLEYRPSVILEVGRAYGNSTATFCEYANRAGGVRVVSVDPNDEWGARTVGRLRPHVGDRWFSVLDARVADIRDVDLPVVLGEDRRIVFFWDAHGADLAEFILGRMFPVLAEQETLVVVHDVCAGRPTGEERGRFRNSEGNRIFCLPPWRSGFEELVYLVDFFARNGIEAHAPTEDGVEEGVARELEGIEPGAGGGGFAYFPLEGRGDLVFPQYEGAWSVYDEIVRRRPARILAYGAGGRGRRFLASAQARGIRVEAFLDGDSAKQGERVEGIEVLPPAALLGFNPDETLVALTTWAARDVASTLLGLGWPAGSLLAAPFDHFESRFSETAPPWRRSASVLGGGRGGRATACELRERTTKFPDARVD